MKELDKTKAYDLRDLNDEQRKELLSYMRINFKTWRKSNVIFDDSILICASDRWLQGCLDEIEERELVSGKTLFEPQLKIGDTFEYEGFICEVKEKIEEKKWYKVYTKERVAFEKYSQKDLDKMSWMKVTFEEITDYHFINLLERHSK